MSTQRRIQNSDLRLVRPVLLTHRAHQAQSEILADVHGDHETVNIHAMVDSGATEDFIDNEICKKHEIKIIKAEVERKIYLANGKLSTMGPVTDMAKVPIDISNHRELAILQVATLQHHEGILWMPWLRVNNPTID